MLKATQSSDDARNRALELIAQSTVCDAMLPWSCTDKSHGLLGRYRETGFDFATITVATDDSSGDAGGDALRVLAGVRALIDERPETYSIVHDLEGIIKARAAGKLALNFNFQGTLPFGKSTHLVGPFRDLGLRQVLLAYNQANFVCDGCSERTNAGLTKVGVALVRELDRQGVIVDGTHCSERATFDAMAEVAGPFIFSHSNAFEVYPHYRNITDDQIRACAETGGFVGVNGLNLFLGDQEAETATMYRHLDHIVQLVGPEYAAIGFDYVQFTDAVDEYYATNEGTWPTNPHDNRPMRGIKSAKPEQMVDLTAMMIEAGYDNASISAILGGNYLRVAGSVWSRGGPGQMCSSRRD